jgi:energy-coupling factor transporter ATP-binding protein EcfA2
MEVINPDVHIDTTRRVRRRSYVIGFTALKQLPSMLLRNLTRRSSVMSATHAALELRGLTKRFDRPAVDGLDLTVRAGEFYALLGANGAGKTTTLRMVAGLLRPDAGSVSILGIDALADPVAAKQIMAWVSDEPMIYDKLTPLEYLEFVAGLWGCDAETAERTSHEFLNIARSWSAPARTLRRLFQGHAPEGRAGRRAGARSPADHSRRTADRTRCRLGASRQGPAAAIACAPAAPSS